MALKRKTETPKVAENSLKKTAEENTTVTKGTAKNQKTMKQGNPSDHHRKQNNTGADVSQNDKTVVGVNIGITKNMDNYESLRVDCWLTDTVKEGETVEQAYNRILGIVDNQLQNTVNSYIE